MLLFNSREEKKFLTGDKENRSLLETKLVSILEDLSIEDRGVFTIEEETKDGILTMLRLRSSVTTTAAIKQKILT